MINLHERMLPTSAGVEPATSWSPVGRRIQMSHRGQHQTDKKYNTITLKQNLKPEKYLFLVIFFQNDDW